VITRIEAHGYRCFPALVVDLDRYHVLAGANGAGKTTLLDIPVLIGDMIRTQRIVSAFLEPQGNQVPRATTLTDLPHKGIGDEIGFAFEARLPTDVVDALVSTGTAMPNQSAPTHLRYELRLSVTPRVLEIRDEYLFLFNEEGNRPKGDTTDKDYKFPQGTASGNDLENPDWQPVIIREGNSLTRFLPEAETRSAAAARSPGSGTRTTPKQPTRARPRRPAVQPDIRPIQVPSEQLALGTVPPDRTLFPAAVWFMETLRDRAIFYKPSWHVLRRAARPGDPDRVMASGRNLPWLALKLQQTDEEEFAAWEAHVRTALPQVRTIRAIEREEDHYAYLSVDYQGGYRVTSSGLSDGTLQILAMSILPYLPDEMLPRILVTEEPENGIHPRAIETVLESLTLLRGSQVWVSTHSPIVLAHTDLSCVLVMRLGKDGSVSVVPGDKHPQLRDWRGAIAIDIGTLFAAGVLN
jgi:Fe-S cluster assembly ATPase SufC